MTGAIVRDQDGVELRVGDEVTFQKFDKGLEKEHEYISRVVLLQDAGGVDSPAVLLQSDITSEWDVRPANRVSLMPSAGGVPQLHREFTVVGTIGYHESSASKVGFVAHVLSRDRFDAEVVARDYIITVDDERAIVQAVFDGFCSNRRWPNEMRFYDMTDANTVLLPRKVREKDGTSR